jgi:acylphosphatase
MTAAGLARRFAVAGWVRNLSDGRVCLLVQGTPGEVERFLRAIREQFDGYIDQEESASTTPSESYRTFEIAR